MTDSIRLSFQPGESLLGLCLVGLLKASSEELEEFQGLCESEVFFIVYMQYHGFDNTIVFYAIR